MVTKAERPEQRLFSELESRLARGILQGAHGERGRQIVVLKRFLQDGLFESDRYAVGREPETLLTSDRVGVGLARWIRSVEGSHSHDLLESDRVETGDIVFTAKERPRQRIGERCLRPAEEMSVRWLFR